MLQLFIDISESQFKTILIQLIFATRFTLYLTAITFVFGGIAGIFICLARLVSNIYFNYLSTAYIWLFQSVPLLMLLFLTGLGVPKLLGLYVDPWLAVTICFTLFSSAYLSEVWRGAFLAVSKNQWEGGYSLGLNFYQLLILIIMPQALKFSIGPTFGFLVQLIKGTSLAYIIGFTDLMLIGKRWANSPVIGSEPYIVFPMMAFIYFILCFPLTRLSIYFEKKYKN